MTKIERLVKKWRLNLNAKRRYLTNLPRILPKKGSLLTSWSRKLNQKSMRP